MMQFLIIYGVLWFKGGRENVTEQAAAEHEPIPPVHVDWLNPAEQHQRRDNLMGEEVNRRVRIDIEERHPTNNWNDLLETNDLVFITTEGLPPEEVDEVDPESDKESDVTFSTHVQTSTQ